MEFLGAGQNEHQHYQSAEQECAVGSWDSLEEGLHVEGGCQTEGLIPLQEKHIKLLRTTYIVIPHSIHKMRQPWRDNIHLTNTIGGCAQPRVGCGYAGEWSLVICGCAHKYLVVARDIHTCMSLHSILHCLFRKANVVWYTAFPFEDPKGEGGRPSFRNLAQGGGKS